jgi:hypothetical protein
MFTVYCGLICTVTILHFEANYTIPIFQRRRRIVYLYDDGEMLARDSAHLLGDHREFLQSGCDDLFGRFQRFFELFGTFGDGLYHARRLFKCQHRSAQLTIKDAAVGDDYNGIKNGMIVFIVQDRKLMRQPRDGVALAASSGVLDQVTATRSEVAGGSD